MGTNTNAFKELSKRFVFRYTNLGRPTYPYGIEPIQLATIINELERLKSTPGNIVEIGVARGMTTRLICEHLVLQRQDEKQMVYAIDTFNSFTDEDLQFEVEERGKSRREMIRFAYNDFTVWKRNFSQFPFVKAIQTDCAKFDYRTIAPIKFAFLDVDMYRPTAATLPRIYDNLAPGGTILVDDVKDQSKWDGAYQAYCEFCEARGIAPQFIGNKGGLICRN